MQSTVPAVGVQRRSLRAMEYMEMWAVPKVVDIRASLPRAVAWRKSSHSNPNGDCVELARLAAGEIAVRDSRSSGGPVQIYAYAQIAGFVQRAKNGEFDETIRRSLVR